MNNKKKKNSVPDNSRKISEFFAPRPPKAQPKVWTTIGDLPSSAESSQLRQRDRSSVCSATVRKQTDGTYISKQGLRDNGRGTPTLLQSTGQSSSLQMAKNFKKQPNQNQQRSRGAKPMFTSCCSPSSDNDIFEHKLGGTRKNAHDNEVDPKIDQEAVDLIAQLFDDHDAVSATLNERATSKCVENKTTEPGLLPSQHVIRRLEESSKHKRSLPIRDETRSHDTTNKPSTPSSQSSVTGSLTSHPWVYSDEKNVIVETPVNTLTTTLLRTTSLSPHLSHKHQSKNHRNGKELVEHQKNASRQQQSVDLSTFAVNESNSDTVSLNSQPRPFTSRAYERTEELFTADSELKQNELWMSSVDRLCQSQPSLELCGPSHQLVQQRSNIQKKTSPTIAQQPAKHEQPVCSPDRGPLVPVKDSTQSDISKGEYYKQLAENLLYGLDDDDFCMDEAEDDARRHLDIPYRRYTVVKWSDTQFMSPHNRRYTDTKERILELRDDMSETIKIGHLREDWRLTDVIEGNIVHIVFDSMESMTKGEEIVVDNEQNMLIVSPDTLLSGTQIADSVTCARKAVLTTRVKTNESSASLLHGTIIHEVFQESVLNNDLSTSAIARGIRLRVLGHLTNLMALNTDEIEFIQKLHMVIPLIQNWVRTFCKESNSNSHSASVVNRSRESKMLFDGQQVDFGQNTEKLGVKDDTKILRGMSNIAVDGFLDIEENFWTPKYGIKGKVDGSILVTARESRDHSNSYGQRIMPFELKTGRPPRNGMSMSHRAQVILYTLMMSDRYREGVTEGLLCYLNREGMVGVAPSRHEIRSLLIARNNLAKYIVDPFAMPETCAQYHAACEEGTPKTAGFKEGMFEELTGHLNTSHKNFIRCWIRLIDMESRATTIRLKEIWNMDPYARERARRCISHLMLSYEDGSQAPICDAMTELANFSVGERFIYRMVRHPSYPRSRDVKPVCDLAQLGFSVGDLVTASTHSGAYGLASGFITHLGSSSVVVATDRPLRIPEWAKSDGIAIIRLDRVEYSGGLGLIRHNILSLAKASIDGSSEFLRRLIIDLKTPRWDRAATQNHTFTPIPDLNADQNAAVARCIQVEEYALILGMPGTGKTTTISHLIKELVLGGKTVLLSSYTHTAVDTVLLKLESLGIDFFRLGNKSQIDVRLHKYVPTCEGILQAMDTIDGKNAVKSDAALLETIAQFKTFLNSKRVVAVTCLGVNNTLLSNKVFDVCIVDEASQVTLPVCIGPLRFARRFILVGDHNQLPPLTLDKEARENGMEDSLFKRLCEAHPSNVVSLSTQYRMNEDIMLLCNTLVYNHKLKCGNSDVANLRLDLPRTDTVQLWTDRICKHDSWITDVVDPSKSVLFLDTDAANMLESKHTDGIWNNHEVDICRAILNVLIMGGISTRNVGLISPYRGQVSSLRTMITKYFTPIQASRLDVYTVDKYQGRDKDVILLSMVRSNTAKEVGMLLNDWRRLNVAFTRARRKIVIIGSRSTLTKSTVMNKFFNLVSSKSWILPVMSSPDFTRMTPIVPIDMENDENENDTKCGCTSQSSCNDGCGYTNRKRTKVHRYRPRVLGRTLDNTME
eukprot:CFRG5432T1